MGKIERNGQDYSNTELIENTDVLNDFWYHKNGIVFRNARQVNLSEIPSVPEGYRPATNSDAVALIRDGNVYYMGLVRVTTSGSIAAYYIPTYGGSASSISISESSYQVYFNMIYPVA